MLVASNEGSNFLEKEFIAGIIDILQPWNLQKKVERNLKTYIKGAKGADAVN